MNITSFAVRLYWFLQDIEVPDDVSRDEKEYLMNIALQLMSEKQP